MKSFKSLREGVKYGGGGSRERQSVKGTLPEWRSKFEAHLFKHHPEHKTKKLDHEQVEHFYNIGRSPEGAADHYHKMHEAGELNEDLTTLPYSYVMKKIQSGVWESKSAVTRGARIEIHEKHGNKKKFIFVKEDQQLDEVKMRGPHSFMRKSTVKDVKYDAPWHVQPQGKTLDRAPSSNTSSTQKSTAMHEEDLTKFFDERRKKKAEKKKQELKESKKGPMPLKGHPYHYKTDAELHYIAKDAHQAAKNMQGFDSKAEGKYLDQVNDAHTVIGYRQRGGSKLTEPKHTGQDSFTEGLKLGDSIHLGFGTKGGAGYYGTIHKLEGEKVHVKIGRDKYGDKIITGPVKHVTLEKELAESQMLPEMSGANWKTRDIHHHLKKLGWALSRTSGSHDVYEHPRSKERIAVPRHKQLKAPLINGILKQSTSLVAEEEKKPHPRAYTLKKFPSLQQQVEKQKTTKSSEKDDPHWLHKLFPKSETNPHGFEKKEDLKEALHHDIKKKEKEVMASSTSKGNDHPDTKKLRSELETLHKEKAKQRESNMSMSGHIWKKALDIKEGLTGPTRMQIQNYFDSTVGSLRSRIYRTEQACGVYDIRLNSHGDIIHFSVTPHHAVAIDPAHSGHQIAYAMHEGKKIPNPYKVGDKVQLHPEALKHHAQSIPAHAGYSKEGFAWRKTLGELEGKVGTVSRVFDSGHTNVDYEGHGTIGIDHKSLKPHTLSEEVSPAIADHTQNPHHKVLTQHGFVHQRSFETKNLGHAYHHVYAHPDHGKSHVEIMTFPDREGKMTVHNTSWHHKYEQSNGILAPSSGRTKPSLDKDLTQQYKKTLKESKKASLVREVFQKGKEAVKKDDQKADKDSKSADKKESEVDSNDGEKIVLSGKKEKFFKEPTLNSINYMSGQGIA